MKEVVVLLYGGLGNQLFQYVFGEYIRGKYKLDVRYDLSSFGLLSTFRDYQLDTIISHIPVYHTNRFFFSRHTYMIRKLLQYCFRLKPGVKYINELTDDLDESIFESSGYSLIYLDGYWQDKRFFTWCFENLPDLKISPQLNLPQELRSDYSFITNNNCISMHVRRGDYLLKNNAALMASCTKEYFSKGLQRLQSCTDNPTLVIFSDDPEWVKLNLHFSVPMRVIDNKDVAPFWYIYLMSLCRHQIISNSTFSWWGTVLNSTPERITIAPKKWFNHKDNPEIYFDNWIVLDN